MGQIACLGAALSSAIAGVYGRRFGRMGVAPLDAAAGQVTARALLILPIMLVVDQPWMLPAALGATTAAALGGLALLSTALAYILYFRLPIGLSLAVIDGRIVRFRHAAK